MHRDWTKYLFGVVLIFVLPAILLVLSEKYNGYLWQSEDRSISILVFPTVIWLYYALVIAILLMVRQERKHNKLLEKIVSDPDAVYQKMKELGKKYPLDGGKEEDENNTVDRVEDFKLFLK